MSSEIQVAQLSPVRGYQPSPPTVFGGSMALAICYCYLTGIEPYKSNTFRVVPLNRLAGEIRNWSGLTVSEHDVLQAANLVKRLKLWRPSPSEKYLRLPRGVLNNPPVWLPSNLRVPSRKSTDCCGDSSVEQ